MKSKHPPLPCLYCSTDTLISWDWLQHPNTIQNHYYSSSTPWFQNSPNPNNKSVTTTNKDERHKVNWGKQLQPTLLKNGWSYQRIRTFKNPFYRKDFIALLKRQSDSKRTERELLLPKSSKQLGLAQELHPNLPRGRQKPQFPKCTSRMWIRTKLLKLKPGTLIWDTNVPRDGMTP